MLRAGQLIGARASRDVLTSRLNRSAPPRKISAASVTFECETALRTHLSPRADGNGGELRAAPARATSPAAAPRALGRKAGSKQLAKRKKPYGNGNFEAKFLCFCLWRGYLGRVRDQEVVGSSPVTSTTKRLNGTRKCSIQVLSLYSWFCLFKRRFMPRPARTYFVVEGRHEP